MFPVVRASNHLTDEFLKQPLRLYQASQIFILNNERWCEQEGGGT